MLHHVNHCVLDYFGIDFEAGYLGVTAHGAQHRISDISHTRLDGQKMSGNTSGFHFGNEEFGHVISNACSDLVKRSKPSTLAVFFGFHYKDLVGVHFNIVQPDPVLNLKDGYLTTFGRILQFIHIVNSAQLHGHFLIQLHDDNICQATDRWRDSYTGGRNNFPSLRYLACLNNGHIDFSKEAISDFLCQL